MIIPFVQCVKLRSTYHHFQHKIESNRDRENQEFTEKMIQIHEMLEKTRLQDQFKMRTTLYEKACIQSIIVKKSRPTPSKVKVEEHENIMRRDFTTTMFNEKWVGDITYIHTLCDGLVSVLDLHTRKVIGYSFLRSMTMELIEKGLENAYVS